jgi:hypothetical protein
VTTYTPIPDSSIDVDSPGTQSLFGALRNNPIAIAEGASGAPRIAHKAITSGAFYATCGAGGAVLTSNNPIPFNSETFDMEGWFSTSTYRYTPQVEGLYLIQASLTYSSGLATAVQLNIRKNGGNAAVFKGGQHDMACSALVYLNGTTDYVDVTATINNTFIAGGGHTTSVAGCLVGHKS